MGNVLAKIIAHNREELAGLKAERPLAELRARAADAPPVRDFAAALTGPTVAVIAEIKRASPSAGIIRGQDFEPAAIAAEYEGAGAAALSVLTDERFFQGRLEHLQWAREATGLPVLRKDFVIDEYQVYEAREAGADAVLLIVAALEPARLEALAALATELAMAALVEVHDERELDVALEAGARLLGVNNRNLTTFEVDLGVTERLAAMVPSECLIVGESGVQSRGDVERLARAGVDAVLVGTALMRAESPGQALHTLTGVAAVRRGHGR
jgi:indole-3-glycerol phosphate synthase